MKLLHYFFVMSAVLNFLAVFVATYMLIDYYVNSEVVLVLDDTPKRMICTFSLAYELFDLLVNVCS